ncbi:TPA: ribokinase [Candidatus Marinimicrobia bacterium]|nr:MAG: Ribokinase [Marinimicrobia bacterium 46_47]HAE87814.1 ribokinase [Candidatus Neomarinimicrobiota bacterium]HBY18834.1 ribokinase [Candidatus Neomarinimicrobiota bacterium]
MKSVLVVGSANMDLVVRVETYPQPGETIFGHQFGMYPGGKGANQAVACAKLGTKTLFVGKMGNDLFQGKLMQNMNSNGVNVSEVIIDDEAPTGIALISVDASGQNEIIVVSGSNMNLNPEDIEKKKNLFSQASIVLTQLEIPLETVTTIADLAKKSGNKLILNPAPARKLPSDLLNKVDYITPNETELALLSDLPVTDTESVIKAARLLIHKGVKHVIVTQGSKGALWVNRDHWQHFSAYPVKAVDSTGAGDAFNGTFACGLAREYSESEAITFANKVAAFSVTRHGAQTSMPAEKDLSDFKLIKEKEYCS